MKKNLTSNAALPFSLLAIALMTTGCSTPKGPPREEIPAVQQFAGKGYLTEEQYSLTTTPVSWRQGEQPLDFLLTVPVRPGKYPLIIYFPGIGEGRNGGEAWRNAWAQAGYAVLSIQLLEEDARLWQSREARGGDFLPLVRARYGADGIRQRRQALRGLMNALLARQGRDPLLANVDLQRVVLAGFDLGAHTAQIAGGELTAVKGDGGPGDELPLLPKALILLSPHADFSGPPFEQRYRQWSLPVLSVTGNGDTDNYGLVTSVGLRTAPFQHMPPGSKYLLKLDDTSHDLLGGGALVQREVGEKREAGGDERSRGGEGGGPEGGRRGGPRGGRGGEPGERGGPGAEGGRGEPDGGNPGMGWGMNQRVVQAVTTAFLDQQLKQDEFAAEWLRRDARRWLRDRAELTVR